MLISVSILGIEQNRKRKVRELNKTTMDYLHLDIMDGLFVPKTTDDFSHIKSVVKHSKFPLDVHVMVKDVIKYVDLYKKLHPAYITFHVEATDNPLTMIDYIKNTNTKVGIAISPNTPIEEIEDYLVDIDLVLVMTVEPGLGGQAFIENASHKISQLKQLREQYGYKYLIEVDGGINNETIVKCMEADILAIGNYITSDEDYDSKINVIKSFFDNNNILKS